MCVYFPGEIWRIYLKMENNFPALSSRWEQFWQARYRLLADCFAQYLPWAISLLLFCSRKEMHPPHVRGTKCFSHCQQRCSVPDLERHSPAAKLCQSLPWLAGNVSALLLQRNKDERSPHIHVSFCWFWGQERQTCGQVIWGVWVEGLASTTRCWGWYLPAWVMTPGLIPHLHGEEAELHDLGACAGLTLQFMILFCCLLVWCVNVLSKVGRPCFIVIKWPQTKTMYSWEMDAG